jgi:hypothetical protein
MRPMSCSRAPSLRVTETIRTLPLTWGESSRFSLVSLCLPPAVSGKVTQRYIGFSDLRCAESGGYCSCSGWPVGFVPKSGNRWGWIARCHENLISHPCGRWHISAARGQADAPLDGPPSKFCATRVARSAHVMDEDRLFVSVTPRSRSPLSAPSVKETSYDTTA